MSETAIPRSSLFDEVVSRLRDEIIQGVWKPGARLQERLLCARFGISRSPLREAYQVLAAEGLLDTSPNRGVVVSAPSPALILENFVLLRALEGLAIELACRNSSEAALGAIAEAEETMRTAVAANDIEAFLHANNEVHRLIVAASENRPLIDAHTLVSRQIIRDQNLRGPLEHGAQESMAEHDRLFEALKGRRPREARRLLDAHLKTVEDNLRKRLEPFAGGAVRPSRRRVTVSTTAVDGVVQGDVI